MASQQNNASAMSNGNAGCEIGVEKQFFNRHHIRPESFDQLCKIVINHSKPLRERRVGRRVNDAALYELISVIFELQRCETNGRNSGVNPQNNHAFSLSYARGCALL